MVCPEVCAETPCALILHQTRVGLGFVVVVVD